jgi:hypothetical protein
MRGHRQFGGNLRAVCEPFFFIYILFGNVSFSHLVLFILPHMTPTHPRVIFNFKKSLHYFNGILVCHIKSINNRLVSYISFYYYLKKKSATTLKINLE